MPLTLQKLHTLDTWIQAGLDRDERDRRAWFNALAIDDDEMHSLLERALFSDRSVSTDTFLDRPPQIAAEMPLRDDLHQGATIGGYTLEEPLGEGGSASVWRARRSDGNLKRDIALKLPFFIGNTRGWHERVMRERDILASLQHPNIATIHDAGVEANGRPWLALELIDGAPIDRHCKEKSLDANQRIALVVRVARAVEYAHARGIIHRDMKPGNILIDQNGQPKLLDFGIAKLLDTTESASHGGEPTMLTRLHGRPFTPEYASPEQRRGDTITTNVDVYALAIVLYELIAGVRPLLEGEATPRIDLRKALGRESAPVSPNSVRSDLDAILRKALRHDIEKRYGTASALADDLEHYLRHEPVLAQPDSGWYRFTRFMLRNKVAMIAVTAIAISLVGGSGVALWQAREAQHQQRIAESEAEKAQSARDFLLRLFGTNKVDQVAALEKRAQPIETVLRAATAELRADSAMPPPLKAELLKTVAQLLLDLQINDEALVAIQAQIAALEAISPTPTDALLLAKIEEARSRYDLGQPKDAISALEAIDLKINDRNDRSGLAMRMEVNALLTHIHASNYERDAALDRGAKALALANTHFAESPERANVLTNYAFALDTADKISESRELYKEAIAFAARVKGVDSFEYARANLTFGESLAAQNAQALAVEPLQNAHRVASKLVRSDSFWIARIEEALARSLTYLGRYREASALFESSQASFAKQRAHIPAATIARNRLRYVEHLLNMGDVQRASQVLDEVTPVLSQAPAGKVALPLLSARMLIDDGQYDSALKLIKSTASDLQSLWPVGSSEQATLSNRIALLHAYRSEFAETHRILDDILTRFPDQSGPIGKAQHAAQSTKALAYFLEGNKERALALNEQIVALMLKSDPTKRSATLTHTLLLRQAIFLKAMGRCGDALPLLAETTKIANEFVTGAFARTQSIEVHRLCLLATNDTAAAKALPTTAHSPSVESRRMPMHYQIGLR